MRYSLEPYYRRYVQGLGFMSFFRNIGNKYGRKIFDKSIGVGKKMSNKYGRKILDKIMDCNWTRTHNHLVHKRTLNQFGLMVECSFMN